MFDKIIEIIDEFIHRFFAVLGRLCVLFLIVIIIYGIVSLIQKYF